MKVYEKSRTFNIGRSTKQWHKLSPIEKLAFHHMAIITDSGYVPVHFTMNLSPKTELSRQLPKYATGVIKSVLNQVLGRNQFLYYFALVVSTKPRQKTVMLNPQAETSFKSKTHTHGCIGIKATDYSNDIVTLLEHSLAGSRLSNKWPPSRGKAVHVSPIFKNPKRNFSPLNMGWVGYIRDHPKGYDLHVGHEVTRLAKKLHEESREGPITREVPIFGSLNGLGWITDALR